MNGSYWEYQPEIIDNVWQDDQKFESNKTVDMTCNHKSDVDEASFNQEKVNTEGENNEPELVVGSIPLNVLSMSNEFDNTEKACGADKQKIEQSNEDYQTEDAAFESLSEDPDDDFGAFEEISTEKVEFCDSIDTLLNKSMPKTLPNYPDDEEFNKSMFLIEGGVRPMRCYNVITGQDRQYLSDKISFRNTTTRGCIEASTWYGELTKLCDEWISDEKGITNEDNEAKKSLWEGQRKINVFKWTTKIENVADDKRPNANFTERRRIGDKLLAASYKEATSILIERIEEEKSEKLKRDQLKLEREKRFQAEKQKREEEKLKYNQAHLDDTVPKKKKNIFGSLFKGKKSKISKDYISHDKLTAFIYEQEPRTKELSLKEELELEGYKLDGSSNKHGKGKLINKRKGKHTKDDDDNLDDDDGEEEEDDDEYETNKMDEFATNGYNIIGETENEVDPTNVLVVDDSIASEQKMKDLTIRDDNESDDEFGSFAMVQADEASNEGTKKGFKDFIPGNSTNSKIEDDPNNSPKSNIPHDVVNLIDL